MAGIYENLECEKTTNSPFYPAEHQLFSKDHFKSSRKKGLLLYHKLGSGKTCTSIITADEMLQEGRIRHVYVLTPGSLRSNWIQEYCETCGILPERLREHFTFVTYNYNVGDAFESYNLNRSLVIIDEAHNLIRGKMNDSKNPTTLYDMIMDSNCRVLLLTGTPVFNDVREWAYMGALLDPNNRYLTNSDFQGVVSYFPGLPAYYPTVFHREPIRSRMSNEQWIAFVITYSKERLNRGKPPDPRLRFTDPARYEKEFIQYIMALKWIQTRKASNFYYDDTNKDKPDLFTTQGGWVSDEALENSKLSIYSPKFLEFFNILIRFFHTKHMVYTFYKTKGGVQILHTLLKKCGIPAAIFSGDESQKRRDNILRTFNSRANRNGDKIKVLLVTDAGAEGITVLETNNIHVLESSTREMKIKQAIGRVVRYKSHFNMPRNRQYVNVWRYFSEGPAGEKGIDEMLYEMGETSLTQVNEFLTTLVENSIEYRANRLQLIEGSVGGGQDVAGLIHGYWKPFKGELKQTITESEQGHTGSVYALTVLPTGELVSGSYDESIKIWKRDSSGNYIHKQTITRSEQGHTDSVGALTVLQTGELVSGSMDETIKIWEKSESGNYVLKQTITSDQGGHTGNVLDFVILPTGELVSCSNDDTIKIWEKRDGNYVLKQTITSDQGGHTSYVLALTVLPTGELVSGSYDNTIKIWEKRGGNYVLKQTITSEQEGHTYWVWGLTVLPTGEFVSGSADDTIKIWEKSGDNYYLKQTITNVQDGHTDIVKALTVLPTGELVFGSNDETIKIWEKSGDNYVLKQTLLDDDDDDNYMEALTVLPTGELVSGSWDRTIKIWD